MYIYIYGSALQPRSPLHGHGLVCTLYLGGFVSDLVDIKRPYMTLLVGGLEHV